MSKISASFIAAVGFSAISLAASSVCAAKTESAPLSPVIRVEVQGKDMMLAQMGRDGEPMIHVFARSPNQADGTEQLFRKITAVLLGSGYQWRGSDQSLDKNIWCKVETTSVPMKVSSKVSSPAALVADVSCNLKIREGKSNDKTRVIRLVQFGSGPNLDDGVALIPGLIAEAYAEAQRLTAK